MASLKGRFAIFLTALLMAATAACGGGSGGGAVQPSASSGQGAEQSAGKIDLTIMIEGPDNEASQKAAKAAIEHFKDKYNITSKQVDVLNLEKTIKTTIASNNPLDLVYYWPNFAGTFVNAGMALDLTPYLDENNGEWRNRFVDGALKVGTYNGKVYAVPYDSVYPLLIANQDILDQAGLSLPDGPLMWDDFMAMLETIDQKTDAWPIGIISEYASWVPRNNLITNWPDDQQMLEFAAGNIPFTHPNVVEAFEAAKELYDKYAYPGKGALTLMPDQLDVAFSQGKVAIIAQVNILAAQSIRNSGLKNLKIGSWPIMGLNYVLGGSDGYLIPANVKHPEASVEVAKFLTSPEIMQIWVDHGTPVAVKGVQTDDPNFHLYSKDAGIIAPNEVINVDSAIFDIIVSKMPANYIFNGMAALEELEKIRQEAAAKKE